VKTGFFSLLRAETRAVFTDKVIMLTVFGGVVLYSFLYPLPYTRQVSRNSGIVVVDLDRSALSRQLIRWLDATPEIRVLSTVGSIEKARDMVVRREIAGFVVIRENFRRDILLGRPVSLAVAGDAAFFLVYGAVAEGAATVGGTLGAGVKVMRMIAGGQELKSAACRFSSFHLNARPVFNTILGYVFYVVPAVFVLILQQTMLIGIGVLGGTQNALARRGEAGYWLGFSPLRVLGARLIVFVGIYLCLSLYYFGFSFDFYGIPRHAAMGDLVLLIFSFLVAVASFGVVLGCLMPRRDLATQFVLLSSLPLVFTSGFVWPTNLIPWPLLFVSNFVPSTPGIQAFLRLGQMGASFDQVMPLVGQLWAQAVGYGLLGWFLLGRARSGKSPA